MKGFLAKVHLSCPEFQTSLWTLFHQTIATPSNASVVVAQRERETVEGMATKEDEATGTHIEERGIDEHCSLLLGQ
jgi:uncharacterized protein YpbB